MCPPYIDVNWRQSAFPDSYFYCEQGLKICFVQLCTNDLVMYVMKAYRIVFRYILALKPIKN